MRKATLTILALFIAAPFGLYFIFGTPLTLCGIIACIAVWNFINCYKETSQ